MFSQIAKRLMDLLGAILGLLFTALVVIPIAVAIKLDSPGPVIFAQKRVGKDLNDERVTRIGRFLRRSSLDELPQFFNILRGEMSLVGPRPIVQEEIHYYGNDFELYTSVLPGLSGLWQVSGRRNVQYPERVWLDAYYVRNRSIRLDLLILFKTFWVVLKRDGAY